MLKIKCKKIKIKWMQIPRQQCNPKAKDIIKWKSRKTNKMSSEWSLHIFLCAAKIEGTRNGNSISEYFWHID